MAAKGYTTVISVREKKIILRANKFLGVVPPTSGIVGLSGVQKIVKTLLLQL
jgi:hypothetical protein